MIEALAIIAIFVGIGIMCLSVKGIRKVNREIEKSKEFFLETYKINIKRASALFIFMKKICISNKINT